jgi:hypothetical protein
MAYTLTSNSPSAGYIAWANASIIYNGVTYPVANGNTSLKYVWWDLTAPTTLKTSATFPTIPVGGAIVFLNANGVATSVLDSPSVISDVIPPGTIQDIQLAGLAASKITGQLTDAQVAQISAAKITGSITSTQITDGAISTPKLAAGAVTANEIAANAITTAKLAAGAVTATELAAGSITTAKLAAGAVTATEIGALAITSAKIAANAITTAKLAAGAVTATEIAAGTITGDRISAGTLTGDKVAAGTLTAVNIAADTITATQIAAGAITASELAANSVIAGKVAAGAISATEIAANAITSKHLVVSDWENLCTNGIGLSLDGWQTNQTILFSPSGFTYWDAYPAVNNQSCFTFQGRDNFFGPQFPVSAGDQFWVQMDTTPMGGGVSSKSFTIGMCFWDKTGATIVGWTAGATRPAGTNGYARINGALSVPANAGFGKIWVQIDATPGADNFATNGIGHHATNIQVRRKNTGSLIVDGSITAASLAAATITGDKIAANQISASLLAAGSVTTDKLVANAVTGDKVSANTITADKIDSRGLSIKDAGGNIILAAGTALADANIPITARNTALALGTNLLYNSDWSKGLWVGWANNGGNILGINIGLNFSGWRLLPAGVPGNDTIFIEQAAGYTNGTFWEVISDPITIAVGKTYAVSAYSGAHRCTVAVFAYVYDVNNNIIGHFYIGGKNENAAEKAGASYLPDYKRIYTVKQIYEAGAVYVRVVIRKHDTYNGNTNSYAFLCRPQFEEVGATATEPGPYNPCGYEDRTTVTASKPITANNVSTYIANAAIGSAQFSGVIQSDNYIAGQSGWQIRRDTGTAEFQSVKLRGSIMGGAFTAWSWPAANSTPGFYLGPEGLLLGNANNGRFFQVYNNGDIAAPSWGMTNGVLTISQANVINTLNLSGDAVTVPRVTTNTNVYWGTNGSTTDGVSSCLVYTFTLTQPGRVIVFWHGEQGTTAGSTFRCAVKINGVESGYTRGGGTMQDSPNVTAFADGVPAGTVTVAVYWAGSDSMQLYYQKMVVFGAMR